MGKMMMLKQLGIGIVLGLLYYVLKLVMRPTPYTDFRQEASRLAVSILVGILVYMLIAFLRTKKTS